MPAEIINLRRFRKSKAREEKAQKADENRARHGTSRGARTERDALAALEERRHEAHRLETGSTTDSAPTDKKS